MLSTYDLDELHHKLQRDIDSDWRTCVQQYPEVLDHYYSVIEAAVRSGRGVEGVIYEEGPSSAPLRNGESVRYSSQERVRYSSPRARESERPSYRRGSGGRVRVVYE